MATQAGGAAEPAPGGLPDRLPRRFGRYLLFDRIGRGGMADIYLALESTGLGAARRVVVKQILAELSRRERFARMLIDEAKLVAELRHANIAQVTDLGREGDRLFIAMEYVEGFDLNQLLRQLSRRKIPLPVDFALFVVREVLAALGFAHRAKDDGGRPLGIVHRDVSPSNVLISFEGEVKLCDFGIARAYGSASDEGAAGTGERPRVIGKAAYMAPEQASGGEVGPRADQLVAGIILWELCAGRRLYRGTEDEMLALARAAEIPPLPDRGLPALADLQAILDRACAPAPEDRFESAEEMLHALDDYALKNRLVASQLRFGAFLSEHFEMEVIRQRRERELAARALELGPPVQLEPLSANVPNEVAATESAYDDDVTDENPAVALAELALAQSSSPAPSTGASSSEPASSEPAPSEPASTEPAPSEPASSEPASTEPPAREATDRTVATGFEAPPARVEPQHTQRLPSVDPGPDDGVRVPIWIFAVAALMLATIAAAVYVLLVP